MEKTVMDIRKALIEMLLNSITCKFRRGRQLLRWTASS